MEACCQPPGVVIRGGEAPPPAMTSVIGADKRMPSPRGPTEPPKSQPRFSLASWSPPLGREEFCISLFLADW